ncbi:Uncharacterised protein [Actinomadura madurae]|nr:Uncharacterised protein [Actinomadura madurae]
MTMKNARLTQAALGVASLVLVLVGCGSGSGDETSPAASASSPSPGGTGTAADEAEVRGLLDKINHAWARGDAAAYASFHTPDADLIDFRGTHARGRQAIIGLLQPAFDGVLENTRVQARIIGFRFLSPQVAIFHTEGKIVPTGADSIQTFVATKGDRGWLIAAFQNTRSETS